MGKLQAIAGVPARRRAKWAVLVFWLIVVAVAGPLAGKLTGAEKNDASAWLPAQAESTKVLVAQRPLPPAKPAHRNPERTRRHRPVSRPRRTPWENRCQPLTEHRRNLSWVR